MLSVVLILLAVFVLHNEKVVEAADNLILLEKRHSGYWTWLRERAVEVDTDQDGSNDVTVFPVSKLYLDRISADDYYFFIKDTERDSARRLIYFMDGTGFDVNKSLYDLSVKSLIFQA